MKSDENGDEIKNNCRRKWKEKKVQKEKLEIYKKIFKDEIIDRL